MLRGLDLTAGMDHADGDIGLGVGEARQVGLGANDGEGALVDRVTVVDVVVGDHAHSCSVSFGDTGRAKPCQAGSGGFASKSCAANCCRNAADAVRGLIARPVAGRKSLCRPVHDKSGSVFAADQG